MPVLLKFKTLLTLSPVACFIFGITIVASFIAFNDNNLKQKWMLRPYSLVERKEWWTLITSGLIHADLHHLGMNMLTFYFFAFNLEEAFLGNEVYKIANEPLGTSQVFFEVLAHAKFFVMYLFCMVAADVTTIFKYKGIPSYSSLGASGAISGVVISAVMMAPSMGYNIWIWGIIPGWVFALLYIGYGFYMSKRSMDNVAHEAHMWGAIAGIIITIAFYPKQSWLFLETIIDSFKGWLG